MTKVLIPYDDWIDIRRTVLETLSLETISSQLRSGHTLEDLFEKTYGFRVTPGFTTINQLWYITLTFNNASTATEFKMRYL